MLPTRFGFSRATLAAFAISLVITLAWVSLAAAATTLDADQIRAVLRTTKEEDNGFIDRAVTLVNAGVLPRDIFESCLIWAKKKQQHRFQYFKRALVARAADIGVSL
jgi:hypothetical protein